MRTSFTTPFGVSLVVAGTILIATMAAPSAQRRTDNASQGAPIATNTILADPDAYYGKLITVSAGVEQIVSKTAFLIDQRKAVSATEMKAIGQPILVIAPYLTGSLDQKHYLLMRGEIVKLDTAAIARVAPGYALDLPADIGAHYRGQPVLVALSVIDSTFAELGKKPLPPPSKVEVSYTATMKAIAPVFTALRAAAGQSNADVVTANALALQPAFTELEMIWDDLGQHPAAQWAREARAHAASIERATAAGNWDAVKTSTNALNTVCQSCHAAYRERQEDGTFRIKPGSF